MRGGAVVGVDLVFEEVADFGGVEFAGDFEEGYLAVFVAEAGDGGVFGAEEGFAEDGEEEVADGDGLAFEEGLVFVAELDADETGERGVMEVAAGGELAVKKEGEGSLEKLKDGVVGLHGLDEDAAFFGAPACAATDLGEQLVGVLMCPEVGEVELEVGVDYADEGDIAEVQAFADHLGAYEDVDLVGLEAADEL